MPRTSMHRQVVYPFELAKDSETSILSDIDFDECTIIGPAVLIVLNDTSITNCIFESRDIFWPLVVGRNYYGGIGVERCNFTKCRFVRMGLAVPEGMIEQFQRGL